MLMSLISGKHYIEIKCPEHGYLGIIPLETVGVFHPMFNSVEDVFILPDFVCPRCFTKCVRTLAEFEAKETWSWNEKVSL